MPMHHLMSALRMLSLEVWKSHPFLDNVDSFVGKGVSNPFRHVELDIDIGADAKDWSAVQATEKLKPVETELRRMEEMVAEIVTEMDYLRTREQKLRDTNESTNTRVKWFAFGTMGMLVALGAWQVVYLRAYFRYAIANWGYLETYANQRQVKASHLDLLQRNGRTFLRRKVYVLLVGLCRNRYIMTTWWWATGARRSYDVPGFLPKVIPVQAKTSLHAPNWVNMRKKARLTFGPMSQNEYHFNAYFSNNWAHFPVQTRFRVKLSVRSHKSKAHYLKRIVIYCG